MEVPPLGGGFCIEALVAFSFESELACNCEKVVAGRLACFLHLTAWHFVWS